MIACSTMHLSRSASTERLLTIQLRDLYMDWIEGKEQPRDMDRAFIGWAKKFTKGKSPV